MNRVLIILALMMPLHLLAQPGSGGYPAALSGLPAGRDYPLIELPAPNVDSLLQEDRSQPEKCGSYRIGATLPTGIDFRRNAAVHMSGGQMIMRLGIRAGNARGLILYYERFRIPEDGKLFIYSKDNEQLIGAFTSLNNVSGGYFATEMIAGEELVIEYNSTAGTDEFPDLYISEVNYVYRDVYNELKGSSGPCEVNINCPEGASWQNEKKSVAKILLKDGGGAYFCTGALVNNARQDSTPYFLTARHCGSSATATDYAQWIFYFCYETQQCEDQVADPPCGTIVGCELIAQAPAGTSGGSDFKLLLFDQKMPDNFNPWFSGWDAGGMASSSGVCIHHPQGDVKKISTYTEPLVSVSYSSNIPNPNADYWKVVWAETISGHGVTEGGSSGSPIFDHTGRIVGTLTGGAASCTNLEAPDYYGKFSSHWSLNGGAASERLEPWLDPDNTGLLSIDGFGYGDVLTSSFISDTTVVSVGGHVQFMDHSTGEPDEWQWTFYGGSPSTYNGKEPGMVTYNNYGEYHVALVVKNGNLSDSLLKRKYIRVTPNIYPVPANERVVIDFGNRSLEYIDIDIYDLYGRIYRTYSTRDISDGTWQLDLDDVDAGNYIMHIKTDVMEDFVKLAVY